MANAQWWVRYTDKKGESGMISLASPDLSNVKLAHKRARAEAKRRLAKRGIKALRLSSQCVG